MGEDGGGKALHRPPRHSAIHAGEVEEQHEFVYTRLSFKRFDLIEHLLWRAGEEITQVTESIRRVRAVFWFVIGFIHPLGVIIDLVVDVRPDFI